MDSLGQDSDANVIVGYLRVTYEKQGEAVDA